MSINKQFDYDIHGKYGCWWEGGTGVSPEGNQCGECYPQWEDKCPHLKKYKQSYKIMRWQKENDMDNYDAEVIVDEHGKDTEKKVNEKIIELLRERAITGQMEVRDKQLMLEAADRLEEAYPYARWILEKEAGMSRTTNFKWRCSNCKVEPLNTKEEIHCHHCGAIIIRK